MRRAVLLTVTMLSMGFAPLPFVVPLKVSPAERDMKAIQGKWGTVKYLIGTHVIKAESETEFTFDRASNTLKSTANDGAPLKWVILDEPRCPRRMVLDYVHCGKSIRMVWHYKVEGDMLTMSRWSDQEDYARDCPTDFEPGEDTFVKVYKRKKP